MSTPGFTPPAGVNVEAGPVLYTRPPQMPGIITSPPSVTAPAVPATTVAVANSSGVDVMVYVLAGSGASATVVKVNGVTLGLTLATAGYCSYYLPAGQTTSITYTGGTLTWVWQAV